MAEKDEILLYIDVDTDKVLQVFSPENIKEMYRSVYLK
jgi:hypothetical protein